jgi:hypothetical protein
MRNIYLVMIGICGTIAIISFDNFPALCGWLCATLAYGLAALERS